MFAHDAEAVETATVGEAFHRLAVDIRHINALHEVVDVFIEAILLTFADDGVGRSFTHAFDAGESETDAAMFVGSELDTTLVDIGSQCLNTQ